jgi:hypothetical protein
MALIEYARKDMTVHPLGRLGVLALALMGAIALAGDGVNFKITNDGIVDIFVTVYDMNTRPRSVVVDHQRINGFTTIPVSASADATGRANISWTAIGVDSRDRHCGHAVNRGLDNDASVNVHVDSDCGP